MHRIITIVAGLLASAGLFAAHGPARAETDPLKVVEDFNKKNPPIGFFIAKGGVDACGPGCDTWIAGDGRFDDEAATRLRKVLNQVGKRKLPIFLQSPGGNIIQAMAVGRLLRSRGMTAGIARTLPEGCWPAKSFDECTKAMREKPAEKAVLVSIGSSCQSACPYALIGASTRLIEPTALVAVHTGLSYFRRTNGVTGRRLELALEKLKREREHENAGYLSEMGIDKGLFAVIKQTPFEKIRFLTRAELFAFGIDRRESLVSGWNVGVFDEASIGYAVYVTVPLQLKTASMAPPPPPKVMTLTLSCDYRPGAGYMLSMLRPISNPLARFDLDFVVSADRSNIQLGSSTSFLTSSHDQLLDLRQTRVWPVLRDALMEAPAINMSGKLPKPDPARPDGTAQPVALGVDAGASYKITNIGAAEARRAIMARCERK